VGAAAAAALLAVVALGVAVAFAA